jgi:hypothetical protein
MSNPKVNHHTWNLSFFLKFMKNFWILMVILREFKFLFYEDFRGFLYILVKMEINLIKIEDQAENKIRFKNNTF